MTKLQELYQLLNVELFETELPELPCFENGRLRTTFGRCHMRYCKKTKRWVPEKIDIQKGLNGEQLRKTLVHEMCHVWAVLNHQETGHGRYFWHKMKICGYPDGHRFETGTNDAWVHAVDFGFFVGQNIRWQHRGIQYKGNICAIHRRTVEAIDHSRSLHWRIPPSEVELVAVRLHNPKQLAREKIPEHLSRDPDINIGDVVLWEQDSQEYIGTVVLLKKGCCLVECESDKATWKIPYAMLNF